LEHLQIAHPNEAVSASFASKIAIQEAEEHAILFGKTKKHPWKWRGAEDEHDKQKKARR
jgi:hypothetical protein